MLSLFRTNQLFLGVFLLFYAGLLRFWPFLDRTYITDTSEYSLIAGRLYDLLDEQYWYIPLFMTLLVWIQALLINSIVARERLATEINLFPGLFYILVVSILPDFLVYSPVLIGQTFVILSVGQLFRIYKVNYCMDKLFNAGLFIGLASLFYSPYIVFMIPILIGSSSLRAFKIKEWLAVIIGGILPLLWLSIIAFMQDELGEVLQMWRSAFGFPGLDGDFSVRVQMGLGILLTLLLVVILNQRNYMLKNVIEVRKKINILYSLLLFSLVFALISDQLRIAHLLVLGFPVGVLLSFFFTRQSRPASELVHLFLLLGIIGLHFATYWKVI